ncbi:hypothetical protein [Agrobacterium sp. CG674]
MFFISEKHRAFSAAYKSKNIAHAQTSNIEEIMQELYAALALLKITRPDKPRNAREEEDKFYADAAKASERWQLTKAVLMRCGSALKKLVQQHQKRRNRTSRDQAEAEGINCVFIGGASNRDSAGRFSGRHHERLPERET